MAVNKINMTGYVCLKDRFTEVRYSKYKPYIDKGSFDCLPYVAKVQTANFFIFILNFSYIVTICHVYSISLNVVEFEIILSEGLIFLTVYQNAKH